MSVLPLQRQKGMECIDAFSMYDMPAVSLVTGNGLSGRLRFFILENGQRGNNQGRIINNMRKLKSAAALLLALVMLLSTTACSGDTTWAAKYGDTTLPVGVYIYNVYNAYYQAYYQTSDSSTPVLEQQINDQPTSDWIKEQASESVKGILFTQQKFKDLGLSFTDEELAQQQATLNSNWAQASTLMQNLGIAKESFNIAFVQQQAMYQKIFEAIYGKGGEKEVSDEELANYYTENYTHYGYFTKSLTTTDEDNQAVDLSDEEIAEIGAKFEEYANAINEGQSPEEVAQTYQNDEGLDTSPYQESTQILDDSSLSEDLISALKDLEAGKAQAIKSGTTYYVIYKYDINDSVSDLQNEDTRAQYLAYMKGGEYDSTMAADAEAFEGVQMNDAAVNKYTPEHVEKVLQGQRS